MSSTTVMDRRTYWCHECDMSISLIPTASLCPHCNSGFIEELDSPITFTNNNNNNQLLFPSFLDDPSADNPFFHRVMNLLFDSSDSVHTTATATATATTSHLHSPASKSAIESIPSVKITPGFLQIDPIVICAVCKDQFVIDDVTKELPCKHMYHSDCILPWLSQRNSCPVCRFQLPIDPVDNGDSKIRRRSRSRVLRLGDLVDVDDDDEELLGFGLRHLARRHRLVFPLRQQPPELLFSPTQIGDVLPDSDSARTNSLETVSSWPVDAAQIDPRVVNDEDDVVMSLAYR